MHNFACMRWFLTAKDAMLAKQMSISSVTCVPLTTSAKYRTGASALVSSSSTLTSTDYSLFFITTPTTLCPSDQFSHQTLPNTQLFTKSNQIKQILSENNHWLAIYFYLMASQWLSSIKFTSTRNSPRSRVRPTAIHPNGTLTNNYSFSMAVISRTLVMFFSSCWRMDSSETSIVLTLYRSGSWLSSLCMTFLNILRFWTSCYWSHLRYLFELIIRPYFRVYFGFEKVIDILISSTGLALSIMGYCLSRIWFYKGWATFYFSFVFYFYFGYYSVCFKVLNSYFIIDI